MEAGPERKHRRQPGQLTYLRSIDFQEELDIDF